MIGPWGGMTIPNLKRQVEDWACSVATAPLKPFQELEIWRHNPAANKSQDTPQSSEPELLKSLDTQIHGHVKILLHLPEQITNAMIYARTQNGGLGITCHTGPYHQRAPQALLEGEKGNDQKASTRTWRMRHARGPLQPIPSLVQAGTAGPKDTGGGRPDEGQSDNKLQIPGQSDDARDGFHNVDKIQSATLGLEQAPSRAEKPSMPYS